MYNNTKGYRDNHSWQKDFAKKALEEYIPKLNWKENETILDIGSGTGDVTTEILEPAIPKSVSKVSTITSKFSITAH